MIIILGSQSFTLFLISMTIKSYIQEIEKQQKKPIKVQLNELKLASAKFLQSIDNLIETLTIKETKS